MNIKLIVVTVFIALLPVGVNAQDPLFTQYYNSPLSINPAYVGTGRNDFRMSGVYRTQWQHLPYSLKYMTIGIDKYFRGLPNVGIQVNHYREGFLYTTQPYLLLGYIPLEENANNNEMNSVPKLSFGMKVGFTTTRIDRSKLLFADQLSLTGITGAATAFDLNKNYQSTSPIFDASAGAMYFVGNTLFGVALNHVNSPKTGLLNRVDTVSLPWRWTVHGGFFQKYQLFNTDVYGKINAIFNCQGKSTQLQVGYIMSMLEGAFDLTFQYKHASFTQSHSFSIGVNLIIGHDKELMAPDPNNRTRMGYSYDFDVTKPTNKTNGGTHELGFLWEKKLQEETCRPSYLGIDKTTYPWGYH